MKLYDGGRAPNPRRVRIFLAEKGITCRPSRSISGASTVGGLYRDQSAAARAGPGARRRHGDHGIGRDLPLFRGAAAGPAAVRPRRAGAGAGRDVEQAEELNLLRVAHVFRICIRHEGAGSAAGAGLGRGQQAARADILRLDEQLASSPSSPATPFTVADITGLVAVDFMKPAKLACRRARNVSAGTPKSRRGRAPRPNRSCGLLSSDRATLSVRAGGSTPAFYSRPPKPRSVDCGASSLAALKARGIDPNRIDGVVLSHLHGDHFGGLPFFLLDAQFLARRGRC